MKNIFINQIAFIVTVVSLSLGINSCNDSWLEPDPLSFYAPENVYTGVEGFNNGLNTCMRQLKDIYTDQIALLAWQTNFTDVSVLGFNFEECNLDARLQPNKGAGYWGINTKKYWDLWYTGIKYANTVISRIDDISWDAETDRNAVLGTGYFWRAYYYNGLVHQFGDVPFIANEITSPKLDFYSHDRWDILERLEEELEFAYKWMPETVNRGKVSRYAAGVLLAKVCMANGNFDRAIEISQKIVAKHPLMTTRFTTNQNKPGTNLMWDLHSVDAKLDFSNTEGIMYFVMYPEQVNSELSKKMRIMLPYWDSNNIKTPSGVKGATNRPVSNGDPEYNLAHTYGRGIAVVRPTNHYQYNIWTQKESNDLRGQYNRDSWKGCWDLVYNNPSLIGTEWYGKKMIKPANITVEDSIRSWYQWPHYKAYVPEPINTTTYWNGGETPTYIYRSAEVYLMMAECYYWKNDLASAASMLNVVRSRAGADNLTAGDITIGEILNERARELYFEEDRRDELVRISYTYAKTGKACEVFDGRIYNLDNISGPGGTASNIKEEGYNFYYDWVLTHNEYFRDKVETNKGPFQMSVHHILWPVPENAISSNTKGVVNQNKGYAGYDNNVPTKPLSYQ